MIPFRRCLFSPRLYSIYTDYIHDSYQSGILERWGDKMIFTTKLGLYTCPLMFMYFCYGGRTELMVNFIGGFVCLVPLSYIMRALGRYKNPKYMLFLDSYINATNSSTVNMEVLRSYDFELKAWPVSYQMPRATNHSGTWYSCINKTIFSNITSSDLSPTKLLLKLCAIIGTHAFGLKMIYPGCFTLVHMVVWKFLIQGRRNLVENFNGKRAKITTADGNSLDTMYMSQVNKTENGKTLVICCEGNCAFYEMGICHTPLKAGYSVLGWNRPGFGESTGLPFPSQENNAMDAVMQYAINELRFEPEDIVLLGWSIGGYTASWAACNYPIKALVLDATFDDLLPLAKNHMPEMMGPFVKEVIRSNVNLDIATMLKQYKGPVKLVRRTDDEMICLRMGDISTNRANHLLMSIIEERHPDVLDDQSAITTFNNLVSVKEQQRKVLQQNDPDAKARKLLTLISKYMSDYASTHCTPLPEDRFVAIMQSIQENVSSSEK